MINILKKLSLLIVFTSLHISYSFCNNQQTQNDISENSVEIIHIDSIPTIVKKTETADQLYTAHNPIQLGISYQNTSNISLTCYKSGICFVKDTRSIKAQSGINEIIFDNLYPGLIYNSLNFRTPKKGKITILSYVFNKKDMSRYNLFSSSIGNEVYYILKDDTKVEKGKLLNVSKEKSEYYALVNNDNKYYSIPLNRCIAVSEKTFQHLGNNSLKVLFDSAEQDNIDLEISYLMDSINWKHICLIDVFEKLDRVDISSQALLNNETGLDIENVSVTFDASSPDISIDKQNLKTPELKIENQEPLLYKQNLTIKKNSEIMCVLKSLKSLKPTLEHIIKIPLAAIASSLSKEIDLPVKNLLTIENAKSLGINADFSDSEVLIFRRINNERSFFGKQSLSSIKSGDDFVFEIGNTPDIIANVQQTDIKKLSEKSVEYGVRISIKNNKTSDVSTLILVDIDTSWNVVKKNFEMQKSDKPLWRLELKPNEIKELYFRIRTNK